MIKKIVAIVAAVYSGDYVDSKFETKSKIRKIAIMFLFALITFELIDKVNSETEDKIMKKI